MKTRLSAYLVFITSVAALGGFLFGFDMAVVSGVLPFIKTQFTLSPAAEGWFVSSALLGCIGGVAVSGELSDKYGRKPMLLAGAFFFILSAAGTSLAPDFRVLIFARILGGMGVGVASILAPLYISEIAPSWLRGRLVTFYQLAVTLGILIAYLSNAAILQVSGHQIAGSENGFSFFLKEPWRFMMGLGAVPSVLFLAGMIAAPESPRWLIEKGKKLEAQVIFIRIYGTYEQFRSDNMLQDKRINHTASEIADTTSFGGNISKAYKSLFVPKMRRPLLLGILLPLFSQFSGINAVIYYGPRILNSAGISLKNALDGQILFGLANFLFTLIAIWKVDQMGRRPLYLAGSIGATIALFSTGFCFEQGYLGGFALISSIVVFLACFAFSIGPLKFVVASEIFPTALSGRAMGLSIMVMWVADTIVGELTPIFLNYAGPGFTFWFFAGCCLLSFFVVYKFLPETKGKSLDEVQLLWKEP